MKKYTPPRVPKPRWINYNKSLISQGTSKEELEVYNFLRLEFSDIPIYRSDRGVLNGRELDIYIPSKNIAVEYNGLYFHNSSTKTPNYHLNKTLQCDKKGIQLISLFSDEWELKKPICMDLLRKAMGKYISIKEPYVRELDFEESQNFFIANHIEGNDPNISLSVGCFLDGRLLSAIGLTKRNENWFISRYAESFGIKVEKGLEEMLGFLLDEYDIDSVDVDVDRRLFSIREYLLEGFEVINVTPPSFLFTKDFKSRFMEEELLKLDEKTIDDLELKKVYDCGKIQLRKGKNYGKN